MGKGEKKVVILIVEGDCEENLLFVRLRSIFKQQQIRFHVYGGDILYDAKQKGRVIKNVVGDVIKEILLKNKFTPLNILAVLHIIDTDGCLIPEDSVRINTDQEKLTLYEENCIRVISERQKEKIINRNEQRSKNIEVMRTVNKVHGNKIDYRMFYFSRNLEHVLFNEPNPEQVTKINDLESFMDNLSIPIENYLLQYMIPLEATDIENQYVESWEKVSENTVSLKRLTNVPLLFDFLKHQT